MLSKKLAWATLVAAVLSVSAAQSEEIRIGAVLPLSGPLAGYGDLFMAGINLAVEHVNADHMLSGILSVSAEDSQALPQRGVVAINKLVKVENTPFVLTALSGVSKAIAPIAERAKVVVVNGGGTSSDLAKLGPYFWNVTPLINYEIKAMLPYLVKERGLKRIALIYLDDLSGQTIRAEMEGALPALGGELVATISVPVSSQQFAGVAALVREAKPDVVYIASYGAQQVSLIKQLRDNGVTQQIAGYSGLSLPEILALPEANGSIYSMRDIDFNSTEPVTKRFVEDYRKKYGKLPESYATTYYNAVRLFALLAQSQQKQAKPLSGENLLSERVAIGSFDLVGGPVKFESDGTIIAPMQIMQVDTGKASKVIATIPIAR